MKTEIMQGKGQKMRLPQDGGNKEEKAGKAGSLTSPRWLHASFAACE